MESGKVSFAYKAKEIFFDCKRTKAIIEPFGHWKKS